MPESPPTPPRSTHQLNLKFFERTIRLAKPYWCSSERKRAIWLLVLLLLLSVAYTEFAVLFNRQSGEFTSALAAQDGPRFRRAILIFFALLVTGVPIDAYYYYVRDTLALNWRRWLTNRLVGQYLDDRAYYHLLSKPEVDNPDQRISDDANAFTQQSLAFVLVLLNSLLQLGAFGWVLWSISSYLVVFLFLYAGIITAVTFRIFGERMVTLHFTQRQREADFRFSMVRLRENAESIASYHGERQESRHLGHVFLRLYANAARIIRWSLRLNFFYYGNSYIAMVLPTLIVAPRVLSGELEVGGIVQATGAFSAILGALSILIDNLESLSRFAASVDRLETFEESLRKIRENAASSKIARQDDPAGWGTFVTVAGAEIAFANFTLRTPDQKRTLIKDLTLSVPTGNGLMIVGASGAGKSSLLRAIAGLWDQGSGTLTRPGADDILFLPQHAYMATGSLRVQLNYPDLTRDITREEMLRVLNLVNLRGLLERCGGFDADFDFEKILSVGERQRLAFARVFLHRPRYVLLDEATSALDRDNETAMYEHLLDISTTLISVTHHMTLTKYHTHILELRENAEWRVHSADSFRLSENLV